jgi:RecA-family ATPase
MVEANRAYALGDEERLRTILEAWASSPEAVLGSDVDATRERLLRRIAQVEEQLVVYAGDLDALRDSPLWQLKAMVDAAAARGKDLVADMIRRLERDIMAARNRLDAMQWNP